MTKRQDEWRWWAVALLPRFVARWLWLEERIPLGSWGPYILGQAIGRRGQRVEDSDG